MNSQTGTTQRARSRMWQRLRALPVNHVRAPQRDGLLRRRHKLLGRIKTAGQSTLDSNTAIGPPSLFLFLLTCAVNGANGTAARARSVTTSSHRQFFVDLRPSTQSMSSPPGSVASDGQSRSCRHTDHTCHSAGSLPASRPCHTQVHQARRRASTRKPFKENQIPT